MKRNHFSLVAVLAMLLFCSPVWAVQYIEMKPMDKVINVPVGNVTGNNVPLITWGGDEATVLAKEAGLIDANLFREDNFVEQVEAYVSGKTPYLRGTLGMINMAAEVLSEDPRTKPVIIYQLTWSTGGDAMVVKSGINQISDLRGKTVAVQAYGPHVRYLAKLLADAGMSMKDVKIKWVKDLTGTDNTPMEAFYESDVDAAMIIIPDALALTSNGSVGTGSEGSVKGAKIMLSTKTANRIIADVYAVRSDYFQSHREEVQNFVHALMKAEEKLGIAVEKKDSDANQYQKIMSKSAEMLLDSAQATADAEALLGDCTFVGFPGNVKFFGDVNYPRNFDRVTGEIQEGLIVAGLMSRKVPLEHARWDYNVFKSGLVNTEGVTVPKFNINAVAQVVQRKQQQGTMEEGTLYSFEIYFQPNQNTFSADMYEEAFNRVVDLASTYGGAVIVIEGHSDPLGYLKLKRKDVGAIVLRQTIQSAKNLSMSRAQAVRDSIINHAKTKGIVMDPTQFSATGLGIAQPKSGMCGNDPCPPKDEQEWRNNMRVEFRIFQLEAETSVFERL